MNWERFIKYYREFPELGLALDYSRMNFGEAFLASMEERMAAALATMQELESGAIANPDEGRMVGHYWLRNSALAPNEEIREQIESALRQIGEFVDQVRSGKISGPDGKFSKMLVVGIGGSALGPQFVANALGDPENDVLMPCFFDNTDPDGMDKVLAEIGADLNATLVIVISKSGGTKETRNGMLEAKAAFEAKGLSFAKQAVAVTGVGSQLDQVAESEGWLRRFPMWDWVGGRTSELCAVGLLPAALQGIDIEGMLKGAAACDQATRSGHVDANPAAILALMWFYAGNGRGEKDMVVLPYKDRLELFSRYLQQLVMESLGKEFDLEGNVVNQGIAVYGNKGSTDQHAYVQQLREGVLNFFVTFIEVLQDRNGKSMDVEAGVTTGDYLAGFYLGTREALSEKGRESITITIGQVSPFSVGVLIGLFERAVGLYASLVGINAYHQPGVEAGKKAAGSVVSLQGKVMDCLSSNSSQALTAVGIAEKIGEPDSAEWVFKICEHLSANPGKGIKRIAGGGPAETTYQSA
jgi:glucose-6-phosphate isomerase